MIRPLFALPHRLQRRHRAVHEAQVGDFGHALELGGAHVGDAREYRLHRVVDPHVDRPELVLEPLRRGEQRVGVRDVHGFGRGLDAEGVQLARDVFERLLVAGDQADAVARNGEPSGDGPSDAGGRSGDEDDAALGAHDSTGTA